VGAAVCAGIPRHWLSGGMNVFLHWLWGKIMSGVCSPSDKT
jgi:hypothetical protein